MLDVSLIQRAEEANRASYRFGCNIAAYLYTLAQEGDGEILEYMTDGWGVTVTRFELSEEEAAHFGVSPHAWSTCYLLEDDQGFVNAQTFWEEDLDEHS